MSIIGYGSTRNPTNVIPLFKWLKATSFELRFLKEEYQTYQSSINKALNSPDIGDNEISLKRQLKYTLMHLDAIDTLLDMRHSTSYTH